MRAGASKILAVTSKGRYFLKFGGYNREYRANIHKRIWHITKIFAVVIHSLLLLLFAYLTIDVQKENNTLQEKTLRQQHESEKDSCGVRWNGKELYN